MTHDKEFYIKKLQALRGTFEINKINSNFKKFWDLNPTEEEFSRALMGVLVTPETIYYMVKNSILFFFMWGYAF